MLILHARNRRHRNPVIEAIRIEASTRQHQLHRGSFIFFSALREIPLIWTVVAPKFSCDVFDGRDEICLLQAWVIPLMRTNKVGISYGSVFAANTMRHQSILVAFDVPRPTEFTFAWRVQVAGLKCDAVTKPFKL